MTELSYSQRMGRILVHATGEVLGEVGLKSVFTIADASVGTAVDCQNGLSGRSLTGHWLTEGVKTICVPPPSRYLERLEQVYGSQPGHGIARRIGRACLPYGLREFGSTLGLTGTTFRLLPLRAKLNAFASALAGLLHTHTDQQVTIEESEGKLLWHVEHCLLCSERHTSGPACHLAVGLAEEALYWLSGGKIFQVEETACIAQGGLHCTLQIDEAPIS